MGKKRAYRTAANHDRIWGFIIKNPAFFHLCEQLGVQPALVGKQLVPLYTEQIRPDDDLGEHEIYLVLLVRDFRKNIRRMALELYAENPLPENHPFHEKPEVQFLLDFFHQHFFDEDTREVWFDNSHIVLNIAEWYQENSVIGIINLRDRICELREETCTTWSLALNDDGDGNEEMAWRTRRHEIDRAGYRGIFNLIIGSRHVATFWELGSSPTIMAPEPSPITPFEDLDEAL